MAGDRRSRFDPFDPLHGARERFPPRAIWPLQLHHGIKSVEDLEKLTCRDLAETSAIGRGTVDAIRRWMAGEGLWLACGCSGGCNEVPGRAPEVFECPSCGHVGTMGAPRGQNTNPSSAAGAGEG